jgi:hypothetical protein
MTTSCPSFLRGNVMRVTRLDGCGRPVYGDGNLVTSDGFVTVTLSAEVQDGEEVTVTKANGQTCIDDKACDQLRWYTVESEFCQVDPDLVQMMNPSWEKILDYQGNTIGYDAIADLDCSTGFGLEVWMNTYGTDDACSGEAAQGSWGYLLLPWVIGGAPGDLEIGNDAVSFSFTGRTKLGSRWGKGPYPVMLGANAIPGPLLTPVGPRTPYRLFVTTVRPPEPECGAQPLDRPTPDPAELTITGVAGENPRRTVRLRADNHGFGQVVIDWGDGSDTTTANDGSYVTHTYATNGVKTITVSDAQTPAVSVTRDVTIPLAADEPTVVLTADDPASRLTVTARITLPEQSSGAGTVDWGDGTAPQAFTVGSDGTASPAHTYPANGVYTVTVRRADITTYRARQAVLVPVPASPTAFLAALNTDASGQTASLTWDNTGNGPVVINWGDGTAPVDAIESSTATHVYTAAGTYTVTVASKANAAAARVWTATLPLPVVTATKHVADATGKTADVTVDNDTAGAVTIDFGDGSATVTNPGDGSTLSTHAYATNGVKVITVTDSSDPTRTGRTTVTIPFA